MSETSPEQEQERVAREFLRSAWATHPELMARWQPPSAFASYDRWFNSNAYFRIKKYGVASNFVEFIERQQVLDQHGGRCGECGEPISGKWHVDHIVPLWYGGDHSYANCQPLHKDCHAAKTKREFPQFAALTEE